MRLIFRTIFGAALLASSISFAQNLPAGAAQDRAKAPTAPVADKPVEYNEEAAVVEKLIGEFRWNADGTGTSTVTARIRVRTQAGVQQLGQLVWGYNSANEKLDIKYLRVSQPDG